ncbi:MAG: ISL3 family transposase [Acidimicrobiia bacterium]
MGDGSSVLLGWRDVTVRRMVETDDGEVVVEIETVRGLVTCGGCGLVARPKDRRWVTVRDVPMGARSVRVEWWKRIWECVDPSCLVRTWTEQRPDIAAPRRVLTARAEEWVTDRVEAVEGTVESCRRRLGVAWGTVMEAVRRVGGGRLGDDAGSWEFPTQVGFDETVMSPASRGRRRRFVTSVVDTRSGRIADVFEGRDAKDLREWMRKQSAEHLEAVKVVSVDPHEGYRAAICGVDPVTGQVSALWDVTLVVDGFHIVRLANQALTKCRQRVQNETLGHRGRKRDPLFGVRKLLLMAAERVDERGWERIHRALREGDADGLVQDAWVAKEYVRDVYLTDDPAAAEAALDRATEWCLDDESGPELRRLAKTLTRWRTEILAHHHTGASNGKTEAANLTIKTVKRSGRGFRNFANYKLRILLAGRGPARHNHTVTSIRTRRHPRLVA